MASSRRWKSLREGGTSALGLPPRRAHALALQQGWRAVAGERLAESVRAETVRGGVLELVTEGKPWRDAVLSALPALAARLASLHPQLGIRKVRLQLAGEADPPAAIPLPRVEAETTPAPPRAPAPRGSPAEPPVEESAEGRLTRLARVYLDRAGKS
ncbi:MAG TPA: DciA family protein [Candidatus Polarisedimenticolaceae bacterium]|nr:DciA family protein [Candidatus Polarisedimenticolaceae bacterium]